MLCLNSLCRNTKENLTQKTLPFMGLSTVTMSTSPTGSHSDYKSISMFLAPTLTFEQQAMSL